MTLPKIFYDLWSELERDFEQMKHVPNDEPRLLKMRKMVDAPVDEDFVPIDVTLIKRLLGKPKGGFVTVSEQLGRSPNWLSINLRRGTTQFKHVKTLARYLDVDEKELLL